MQGYDGFLSSKDTQRRRQRSFRPEDRLFSLSSVTSDASKEDAERNEAPEGGPGWVRSHKAGGGWVRVEDNAAGNNNKRRKK